MKPPAERKIIAGLVLAVWIFLMAVAAAYWDTHEYIAAHRGIPQMGEVSRKLKDVLLLLGRMESDERSYLQTGDPVYLDPAHDAVAKVEAELHATETLAAESPETRQAIAVIQGLLKSRGQ